MESGEDKKRYMTRSTIGRLKEAKQKMLQNEEHDNNKYQEDNRVPRTRRGGNLDGLEEKLINSRSK